MSTTLKRIATAALAILFALALSFPAFSYAEEETLTNEASSASTDSSTTVTNSIPEASSTASNSNSSGEGTDSAVQATPANDCTVTLKYYENVVYEEPGIPAGPDGRYLLGTRTLTGLQEGEVLDTWDYVVDIPGFFFFDAWPAKLTVSTNPEQNEITLIYARLWNASYTVNYYLMEGADLYADNWTDALAPEGVEFIKLGSETFENQPYGKLVEGDAYEYKVNGMYAIDSYPAEIRAGLDTDNDTINILYAPDSVRLPDNLEVPDEVIKPSSPGSGGSTDTTLPPDESFTQDEIVNAIPGVNPEAVTELFEDMVGDATDTGTLEITDEMLAHPQSKEEAERILAAYNAGLDDAAANAQPQATETFVHWLCIIIAIILFIFAIIGWILFGRERHQLKKLQTESAYAEPMPRE